MKIEKSPFKITMSEAEFMELSDDSQGICLNCGALRDCTEPDARHYNCEECGKNAVFGAEECLMRGKIHFIEPKQGEK